MFRSGGIATVDIEAHQKAGHGRKCLRKCIHPPPPHIQEGGWYKISWWRIQQKVAPGARGWKGGEGGGGRGYYFHQTRPALPPLLLLSQLSVTVKTSVHGAPSY